MYPDNLAMKLSGVYTYRLCLEALKAKTASSLYLGKEDKSAPKAKKEAGMFQGQVLVVQVKEALSSEKDKQKRQAKEKELKSKLVPGELTVTSKVLELAGKWSLPINSVVFNCQGEVCLTTLGQSKCLELQTYDGEVVNQLVCQT